MAKNQELDRGPGYRTLFNSQLSSRADLRHSKDLESFRRLMEPYLQQLEDRGRLGSSEETLDIISAILEHHMIKASITSKN